MIWRVLCADRLTDQFGLPAHVERRRVMPHKCGKQQQQQHQHLQRLLFPKSEQSFAYLQLLSVRHGACNVRQSHDFCRFAALKNIKL